MFTCYFFLSTLPAPIWQLSNGQIWTSIRIYFSKTHHSFRSADHSFKIRSAHFHCFKKCIRFNTFSVNISLYLVFSFFFFYTVILLTCLYATKSDFFMLFFDPVAVAVGGVHCSEYWWPIGLKTARVAITAREMQCRPASNKMDWLKSWECVEWVWKEKRNMEIHHGTRHSFEKTDKQRRHR